MKKIFTILVISLLAFVEVNAQNCNKQICFSAVVNGKDTIICSPINICIISITNEMIKPATKPDIIDPNFLAEIIGKLGFKIKKISGSLYSFIIVEKATKKILVTKALKKNKPGIFISPAS